MHDHYLAIMIELLAEYGVLESQLRDHAAP
jgi:hypothetical protein